jgi:hypothetical protein
MRRVVRFESADGMHVLELPLTRAEQEEGQSARLALLRPPLTNYAADLQGSATVVADVADIRHRAVLIEPDGADADLDRIRALLRRIGRGRLWMRLSDDTERWCWARAGELGHYQVVHDKPIETGLSITFQRLSDWYGAAQRALTQTVTSSPASFTLVSDGTVATRQLEIEITALSAGGFTNPQIRNVSAAMGFGVTASSSAPNQKILVTVNDVLSRRARFWDGASWQEVPITLGPTQSELFVLVPGSQLLQVEGVTDGIVSIRWYDAYA